MPNQELLQRRLHQAGQRLTRPRRVVYEFFSLASEPIQLPHLIAALSGLIDRASIYRTITLFEDLGIIHQVHRPGKVWLELGEDFSHHHHHITCIDCGLSQTITSPALEAQLSELARQAKFAVALDHQVEIAGRCQDCLTSSDQEVVEQRRHR